MIILLTILLLPYTAHAAYTAQQAESVLSRTEKIAFYREIASEISLKNRTDLTLEDWGNLASVLKGSMLVGIQLNGSSVGDIGLKQLIPALPSMINLQQIALYQTGITDEGVVALCDALGSCSLPLQRVDMRSNEGLGVRSLVAIKALKIMYPNTKIEVSLSAEMLKDLREEPQP